MRGSSTRWPLLRYKSRPLLIPRFSLTLLFSSSPVSDFSSLAPVGSQGPGRTDARPCPAQTHKQLCDLVSQRRPFGRSQ